MNQVDQEGGCDDNERIEIMIYCSVRVERLRKGEDREPKVMLERHNMISFPESFIESVCIGIVRMNIEGIVGLAMSMVKVNTNIFPSYDKLATMTNGHLLVFVTAGNSLDECYKVDLQLHC